MKIYNNFINKIFQSPEKLNFRWRIINPTLVLIVISCLTLKYTNSGVYFFSSTYIKQLVWISMGILILITIQWIRIQFLHEYAYHFYTFFLLMILLTYIMPIIGGSQRWILIGPISFQPSEIGKLFLVFALARFISDYQGKIDDRKILFIGFLIVLIPNDFNCFAKV